MGLCGPYPGRRGGGMRGPAQAVGPIGPQNHSKTIEETKKNQKNQRGMARTIAKPLRKPKKPKKTKDLRDYGGPCLGQPLDLPPYYRGIFVFFWFSQAFPSGIPQIPR